MAGFFLVRDDSRAAPALLTARAQYALHGFAGGTEVAIPGWRLVHWPYISGGPDMLLVDGDDMVAVAGTIAVDGLMGAAALRALLARAERLPVIDWKTVSGQFAAVVRRRGRTFLFGDFFGAYPLYHDAGHGLFSTSLLAAAKALPKLSYDAQGVYEFAFNVVPIGDDTVFSELKSLGPRTLLELDADGTVTSHRIDKALAWQDDRLPVAERLAQHRDALMRVVETHVAAFGDHIQCPLSGGMDSRLLLAALRAAGAKPSIYVYGPASSPDVQIAQAIGKAEGFPVEWIDKQSGTIAQDAFAAQVLSNYHRMDGLPNFGNIFDTGANVAATEARHTQGALAASGGCGEIWRDFFYLPNVPMRAGAVAQAFFSRFDARDATTLFQQRPFTARIAAKIAEAVGEDPRATLARGQVEQVYPRIRCRSLFGREISMEARYGAYMMPFLDQNVVAHAMTLPMRLKRAGHFEAMLIHAIDPALARHPSAYGHAFDGPPSLKHRMSEWSTRLRPACVRARSYAWQRRLRPMGDEHGGVLDHDYMGRAIDLAFPAMRKYFRMENVADSGLWRRIANLEYVAADFGSQLAV